MLAEPCAGDSTGDYPRPAGVCPPAECHYEVGGRWGAGRGQEQLALRPPSSAPPTHTESELSGEVVSQAGEAAPSWPGSAPAGGWGLIL